MRVSTVRGNEDMAELVVNRSANSFKLDGERINDELAV